MQLLHKIILQYLQIFVIYYKIINHHLSKGLNKKRVAKCNTLM
jgi:hypothetical protein